MTKLKIKVINKSECFSFKIQELNRDNKSINHFF